MTETKRFKEMIWLGPDGRDLRLVAAGDGEFIVERVCPFTNESTDLRVIGEVQVHALLELLKVLE